MSSSGSQASSEMKGSRRHLPTTDGGNLHDICSDQEVVLQISGQTRTREVSARNRLEIFKLVAGTLVLAGLCAKTAGFQPSGLDGRLGKEQLLDLALSRCEQPEDCPEWKRRMAVTRLAKEFPDDFLAIARDLYESDSALGAVVAVLYWQIEVVRSPPELRTELLWEIFHGRSRGILPSDRYIRTKTLAADLLCESGQTEAFPILRDYHRNRWRSVQRAVDTVAHCHDRMFSIGEFGSKTEAARAILDGSYTPRHERTLDWALVEVERWLESGEVDEHRYRTLEQIMVSRALEWQSGPSEDFYLYNRAIKILYRQFSWTSQQSRAAGLTLPPMH